MKSFKVVAFLAVFLSSFSAKSSLKECQNLAKKSVLSAFKSYFTKNQTSMRRIELVECEKKISLKNNPYVRCSLSASNGDGAGDVEFQAILNNTCTKTLSTFIIGEE